MKQDETLKDGLETLERILGPGGPERPPEKEASNEEKEQEPVENGSGGNTTPPPEAEKPDAPPSAPSTKKSTPVFVYLAIMFAAAFLMLLLAYFIQERNSAMQIGNLQSAMESFQSLDDLVEENQQLRDELQSMTDENAKLIEEAKNTDEMISSINEASSQEYQEKLIALNMFYLENLMRVENYEAAAGLYNTIVFLDANTTPSSSSLPILDMTFSTVSSSITARERLQEIGEELTAMGYTLGADQFTGSLADLTSQVIPRTDKQISLGYATIHDDDDHDTDHDEVHH